MQVEIQHETHYKYSEEVFPGTHYLYFRPLNRPYQRLISYDIETDPVPAGLAGRVDRENNVYYQLWYLDKVSHLHIRTSMVMELNSFNPYDFLIDPPLDIHERFKYSHTPTSMLEPYLSYDGMTPEMNLFIEQAIGRASGNVLDFFQGLNQEIAREWDHAIRLEENILEPSICFEKKSGSCRDLAWMLINMLRSKGFACRFISGYSYVPGMKDGHELHAWLEVLLPGAGWLAMDPTLGLLVTEHHIPLAASYDPANTLPVQGSYHGSAKSEMSTEVIIRDHQP